MPDVGDAAPDTTLLDEAGRPADLRSLSGGRALVVLFLPWPLDGAATRMLRDYRDSMLLLKGVGARVAAVVATEPSALSFLRMERGVPFPVLSDPDTTATSSFGMTGKLGLVLLDGNFIVRMRAFGERAPAAALLTFVKRGGATSRPRPARIGARLLASLRRVGDALRAGGRSVRAVR